MNADDLRMHVLAAVQLSLLDPENAPDVLRALEGKLVHQDANPIDDGDIIYVRHGAHDAVRIAYVQAVGAGPDDGFLVVRVWSATGKLQRMRKMVVADWRGFPSPRDKRAHALRHAIDREHARPAPAAPRDRRTA
jgi:hypothetical protein